MAEVNLYTGKALKSPEGNQDRKHRKLGQEQKSITITTITEATSLFQWERL